jgi:DoxX.
MVFAAAGSSIAFVAGRALFAVVVGYLAFGNLRDLESAVGYAESKGAPLASVSVPLGSLGLVAGALAVLTGIYPTVGALAIVAFLVPITVIMHDFWTMEGHDRQNEQIHFLKNVGLIGIALILAAVGTVPWPAAAGIGL